MGVDPSGERFFGIATLRQFAFNVAVRAVVAYQQIQLFAIRGILFSMRHPILLKRATYIVAGVFAGLNVAGYLSDPNGYMNEYKMALATNPYPDEAFRGGAMGFRAMADDVRNFLGRNRTSRFDDILSIPKGSRPDPRTYMSRAEIDAHLAKFDEGAVRFTSREAAERYGTVGPDGGFVMPKSEFDRIVMESGGDLRMIEQKLGLDVGYLGDSDTMIVHIAPEHMDGLRIPSGNEAGSHETLWRPRGFTSGGVAEAVMDFSGMPPVSEITLTGS